MEVLLAAGADRFIRDADGRTPLELVQNGLQGGEERPAITTVLKKALAEQERGYMLFKARKLNDILLNMKKAAKDATGRGVEGKRQACLVKAPTYLKARLISDTSLPKVSEGKEDASCCKPWDNEAEEEERMAADVTRFVVGEGAAGEVMNVDLLPTLLDFMAPLWDPARKRG